MGDIFYSNVELVTEAARGGKGVGDGAEEVMAGGAGEEFGLFEVIADGGEGVVSKGGRANHRASN
jgi:hypothetical protein